LPLQAARRRGPHIHLGREGQGVRAGLQPARPEHLAAAGGEFLVMLTIDAQVHTYERNHAGRPWAAVLHGPPEVTGDDMVAAMDAVGVDGALLVSPFTLYRYDASYA